MSTPAPAYYNDYEDEVPAATPRPVQLARPKYAVPTQQQPQPQYSDDFEFSFGPLQKQTKTVNQQPQYQQFDNRQPVQFPAETESPVSSTDSRSDQFQLFTPQSRADSFKPKVRSRRILRRSRKRRKKSRVYIIFRKKKRYID